MEEQDQRAPRNPTHSAISVVAVTPTQLQVPPNCDLTLGMVCVDKTEPGRTTWKVTAHERFANPAGTMQGGFVAACCDSAMGAAAVTSAQGGRVRVANAEMKISFLRPIATGDELVCEATVVGGGTRVAFVEATLAAADGTVVARASSTYLISERA